MSTMNVKRILLGGLLAGLVINISETVLNMVVVADSMQASLAAMNGGMTAWAMPFFMVMAFVWGIALTGLYAAVRPRLGAGPRTALIVGGVFWLLVSFLPTLGNMAMGLSFGSAASVVIALAWTLVEMPLAALVGARVYQEAGAAEPARAAAHAGM